MKKITDSPHLYAFITILFWAPTFALSRMLAPYVGPAQLGFLRFGFASLVLVTIILVRKLPLPEKKDLPLLALAALCGFSLYMILFNHGVSLVNAATSSVVIAITPIFTDVLASILFKEQLKPLQWGAIAIEFCGLSILALSGSSLTLNTGVLWLLVCAFILGCYNIIQRRLSQKYGGFITSAMSIIFGALELIWAAPQAIPQFTAAPLSMRLCIIFLGIFASGLGYVLWSIAFSKAEKTSDVANYMFITPFFAAILGIIINHEVPSLSTVLGGLIILSGVLLFNRGK